MSKSIPIDWPRFSDLASKAIAAGNQPDGIKVGWDISGGCSKPYQITLVSAVPEEQDKGKLRQYMRDGKRMYLDIDTPCRKCESCLINRQRLWRRRMKSEIALRPRTWMMTFTISPQNRFIFSLRAGSSNYIDSYKEISKEITKYFKRLRKKGFKFRYVVVAEAHKNGYPHLHALVHEVYSEIPKSRLQSEWPHGFTHCKLVDRENPSAHYYVAKYLAKDARTRIRASQRYGQSVRFIPDEVLQTLRYRNENHSVLP